MNIRTKNILAALLTFALAAILGMTCNAQSFTPPPVHFDEVRKTEPVDFAIRKENAVTFISFLTDTGDDVKCPMLFAFWTARKSDTRTITVFVDDKLRGYPMLEFTLHIACTPVIDIFPITQTINTHD